MKETFTTNRLAIAGVGVNHKLLEDFATACGLPGGEGDKTPSPYGGGEIRIECGGPLTSVAMAVEGFRSVCRPVFFFLPMIRIKLRYGLVR